MKKINHVFDVVWHRIKYHLNLQNTMYLDKHNKDIVVPFKDYYSHERYIRNWKNDKVAQKLMSKIDAYDNQLLAGFITPQTIKDTHFYMNGFNEAKQTYKIKDKTYEPKAIASDEEVTSDGLIVFEDIKND